MVTATVTATSGNVNQGDDRSSDVCLLVGAMASGLGDIIEGRLSRVWVAGRYRRKGLGSFQEGEFGAEVIDDGLQAPTTAPGRSAKLFRLFMWCFEGWGAGPGGSGVGVGRS